MVTILLGEVHCVFSWKKFIKKLPHKTGTGSGTLQNSLHGSEMYMVYNLNNLKLSTNPTVSSQNPLLPYIAPSGPNSLMTEAKGAPSTHLRSFSSDSVVSLAMDACSSSSCQRG